MGAMRLQVTVVTKRVCTGNGQPRLAPHATKLVLAQRQPQALPHNFAPPVRTASTLPRAASSPTSALFNPSPSYFMYSTHLQAIGLKIDSPICTYVQEMTLVEV